MIFLMKKKKKWLVACVFLVLVLLLLGGFLSKNRLVGQQGRENVFEGGSDHWDQSQVPVALKCGACHEKEFREWASSDHAWAFRNIQPKWDAKAFQGQNLKAHGSELTFFTDKKGERRVYDQEKDRSWNVQWVTGRIPLVQYLVPSEDGGFHTLSAAWDVKREEWFDIFDGEERTSRDWGHWLGRGMNWNSQCAWCHMTGFKKNYDPDKDAYSSTWLEPGVSCVQCHGPLLADPEGGTGCMVDSRKKFSPKQIHDNCAACHARRGEMDDQFKPGDLFEDHFVLVLPVQPGIFWPNGMQRDEAYCETGMRLSKMGKAGVRCVDCHNYHTGKLRLPFEDNSLCMRCHETGEQINQVAAPRIEIAKHTPCPKNSAGVRCVECHMPESLFMARDPRRDHSFNSPDPLLSKELGMPNACIMCHKDNSDEWAMSEILRYYGNDLKMDKKRQRTRAVQWAYDGEEKARDALLLALKEEDNTAWQATLLSLLEPWAGEEELSRLSEKYLTSQDPLVRAGAIRLLVARELRGKIAPLLDDSVKLVRIEAARVLADQLADQDKAKRELLQMSRYLSDQPSGIMSMARIEVSSGNLKSAEGWFLKAIKCDPTSSVVYREYAVFLSSQGRVKEACEMMKKATRYADNDPATWYLYGLASAEIGENDEAIDALTKAGGIDSNFIRAFYNRGLLYYSMGKVELALKDLDYCSRKEPLNPEFPYIIAVFYFQNGNADKAVAYVKEALRRQPGHRAAETLRQQLLR